ncbi:hypothetical protein [Lentzea flava]|nr:hypothetical protein [Lentzea flava]
MLACAEELLVPSMSRVELYAAIRRDSRAGVWGREIERRYNFNRW